MEEWIEGLEELGPNARRVSIAYVAGQDVAIPQDEMNEALRRAVVVRAVGGDPSRELELEEDAVLRLADELDRAEARDALRHGLESLRPLLEGRSAARALDGLLADADLAWRCFAAARLAEAVGD